MAIPKVIHYCWFGEGPLSPLSLRCIESWKTYCPNYEIIQWNEHNFVMDHCRFAQEAYLQKNWAFLSDYVRLKLIYEFGGFYFDTDVELLKSIDELTDYDAFFAMQDDQYINTGLGFGAKKKCPIVGEMLKEYLSLEYPKYHKELSKIACPILNTKVMNKYRSEKEQNNLNLENIMVFPPEYFCPKDYVSHELNITNATISIHHFNESWIPPVQKIVNKVRHMTRIILGDRITDTIKKVFDI